MSLIGLTPKELLNYAEPKTELEIRLYEALKETYEQLQAWEQCYEVGDFDE